jgi:N-acetyl sugar amidotransferase
MDKSDPNITFDKLGVCNHCDTAQKELLFSYAEAGNFNKKIANIKKDGQNNKYDCLIGLSGGVDSSTALHYLVKNGLRPLCYSMDNGYNDPKADENIFKLVEALKVPFEKRIINLDIFKELQSAFIKAGVKNIEIPTDHILMALSYQMAAQYNIKWIISGGNVATESIMPVNWGYNARDLIHIKDIYKKFNGKKLKGLPVCGLLKFNYYKWIKKIKIFYILDYLNYNRKSSERMLIEKYGFQSTGEKHEENIFTRWFQNWYLFEKYGIDKRKAHLSSLINSGQITKKEANLLLIANPIYPELGIEKQVMKYPKHSHYDYKTDEKIWLFITNIIRALRKPYRILTKIGKSITG